MRTTQRWFVVLWIVTVGLLGFARAGEEPAEGGTVQALHAAVERGDREAVRQVLEEGPGLVNRSTAEGRTALHLASRAANAGLVDQLLEKGGDPDARNGRGRTPLHMAAQAGAPAVVKSLLLGGAHVNARDRQGATPLDLAATEDVRLLLRKQGGHTGADLDSAGDRWVAERLPASLRFLVERELAGFPLWRLAGALAILIVALVLNTVLRYTLKRYVPQDQTEEATDRRVWFGLLLRSASAPARIIVWAGAARLVGPLLVPAYRDGAVWMTGVLFSVALAVFLYQLVAVVEHYLKRRAERTENTLDDMLVPIVRKGLRLLVIIVASVHIYQSVTQQPITTVLAGLGLGGLAFALAAQDTLKNFFGFIMIAADRPFNVGERIDFDGHDGVVEAVGLRSTRVRRLDGHVVTIPNSRAADGVIHNIGRRPYIRRIMNITITYDTPIHKVEKAVQIVRDVFENHEGMDEAFPPRVYFNDFNAASLNIIVIYWYHPPEYWDYLAHCQAVNLEIMRRFEAEGIEFAFPTQTLYLAGDPARELVVKHQGLPEAGGAGPGGA